MTKTSTNKDTKMLTVNIPADMFDKFKQECKTDNLTMSEAIKGFIQSYLDGNLEAMATGMIGDNTTAKQIEEAVERKIDDYISNEIDQVVTRHLETDLDVKLDSILEKKLDKYLDDKLESRLKAKLETNLDNNTDSNLEHNLETDTDSNLDDGNISQNNETPEKKLANDERLLKAIAEYIPEGEPKDKLKPLADIFVRLLKEYGIEDESFCFTKTKEADCIKSCLGLEGKKRPKEGGKFYRAANILLEAYQIAEPQNES